MKIRIVTVQGVQEIESTDPIAALEIRGFEVVGLNQNKMQRIELQGAPLIKCLCAPCGMAMLSAMSAPKQMNSFLHKVS